MARDQTKVSVITKGLPMASASRGIKAAHDAWQPLQRGLALALDDVGRGRDELLSALAGFETHHDAASLQGRLIAAAALLQFIGIADDHYGGFEHAVEVVHASHVAIDTITDPDHRLLARSGTLVAGWFRALDDPALTPLAETITRELGNEAVGAPVRCCAGLAVLAYFVIRFDLEKVLWVELAMRRPLASADVSVRLAEEWHQALTQGLYECAAADRAVALRASKRWSGSVMVSMATCDACTTSTACSKPP
jgi:hypothetical protein